MRNWACPNCQTLHDRDINAAMNILNHATKVLTN
ncbi:zinc ribbon domain-containing protein [Faucicola mancuniensis]